MCLRRVAIVTTFLMIAGLFACGDVGSPVSDPEIARITPMALALSRQVILNNSLDFDGDGKSDIVWRNDDGTIAIWLMNGTKPRATPVVGTMPAAWKISGFGDFDGDGKSDILWRNDDGTIAIWLMDGATPRSSPVVGTMPAAWQIAGEGDFDGDGKSDILWRNDDGTIAIWLMNGATPRATPVIGTMPAAWQIAGTGDFDGDGKSDIVWRKNDGTRDEPIAIWLMNGSTPKATPVVVTMQSRTKIAGIGDFDGDGKSDILFHYLGEICDPTDSTCFQSGSFYFLYMNGTTIKNWSTGSNLISKTQGIANTGDYDGDGVSDILWRNDDGTIAIWFRSMAYLTSSYSSVGSMPTAWKTAVTSGTRIAITPMQNAICKVNQRCSFIAATASGGWGTLHFESDKLANGPLPMGMVMYINGIISGTPGIPGTYSVGVCAVDLTGRSACTKVAIVVEPALVPAPTPTPTPPPATSSTLAIPASQVVYGVIDLNGGAQSHVDPLTVIATGGHILSGYSWTPTAGSTPPNPAIAIDALHGVISGRSTTLARGTFAFYATVTDDAGASTDTKVTIDLTQTCNSLPSAMSPCMFGMLTTVHNDYLPRGKVNAEYAATIITGGGTPPYGSYRVASGALPSGITIDSSRGVLRGTPTAAGTFDFYVQVTDAGGASNDEVGVLAAKFRLVVDP